MLRWKTRKNTSVGTAAIAEAASTRFCGVVLAASKMPTFRVSRFGVYPYSTSSGHRKSFHTATREKIETTPMIGREIGSTTERRVRSGDAPSTAPADTRTPGIESKNRLSRKMLKALATEGSQMASGEPIRVRCRSGRAAMVTHCGTASTLGGV